MSDEYEKFRDAQDYLGMYRAMQEREKAARQQIEAQHAEPENTEIKAHIEAILKLMKDTDKDMRPLDKE